jgi:hypothetical protein
MRGVSNVHGLTGRERGMKLSTRARIADEERNPAFRSGPDCDISLHADKSPKGVHQRPSASKGRCELLGSPVRVGPPCAAEPQHHLLGSLHGNVSFNASNEPAQQACTQGYEISFLPAAKSLQLVQTSVSGRLRDKNMVSYPPMR